MPVVAVRSGAGFQGASPKSSERNFVHESGHFLKSLFIIFLRLLSGSKEQACLNGSAYSLDHLTKQANKQMNGNIKMDHLNRPILHSLPSIERSKETRKIYSIETTIPQRSHIP